MSLRWGWNGCGCGFDYIIQSTTSDNICAGTVESAKLVVGTAAGKRPIAVIVAFAVQNRILILNQRTAVTGIHTNQTLGFHLAASHKDTSAFNPPTKFIVRTASNVLSVAVIVTVALLNGGLKDCQTVALARVH